MTRSMLFAAVLAAVSLPAAAALSQGTQGQGQSPPGQAPQRGVGAETKGAALAKHDREFVDEAALGGLFEVKAGQLAQQKAQADDVKKFGQRMIDDHTAVNSRLQKLAQQKGLSLPQTIDKKHQDKLNELSKKTGADFDKSYLDDMVDDHKKDVDAFDKASRDAKDSDIKEFSTSTLPTLRDHLKEAQGMKDKLKS